MTDSRNENTKSHRLFHAMVLMGGSLALGCGGVSTKDLQHNSGESDSGGAPSGSTGGGGSPGSAGRKNSGSGGSASAGMAGTVSVSMPAGAGGQTPVVTQPPPCPPEQWDCTGTVRACSATGFGVPNDCRCDASRPKSPADCPKGQSFVCHNGTHDANYKQLSQPIAFDCVCMPEESDCELVCDELSARGATCTQKTGNDGTSVLCNCAVIVLR